MWHLLPIQPEAVHSCEKHLCLQHPFGVIPGDIARGWDVGTMGQVPGKFSPLLLQGHPETLTPSKQWRGEGSTASPPGTWPLSSQR